MPENQSEPPALKAQLPPLCESFAPLPTMESRKFCNPTTDGNWYSPETSSGQAGEGEQTRAALAKHLASVLLSENLVVVTGLGTSLCIRDVASKRLAPLMGDLWDRASTILVGKPEDLSIEKLAEAVGYRPVEVDSNKQWNIEELLTYCHAAQRFRPDTNVEAFVKQTESDIAAMCRFTGRAKDFLIHEDFLRRVARRPPRKPRLKLFTTNYDLAFETAASRSRFVVIDGFSHTFPQEFDGTFFGYDIVRREGSEGAPDYISNVFHLYKLHGSVDWSRQGSGIVKDANAANPVMIYPRDTKFAASFDQPHLEMMARFLDSLRQPKTGLLIVGFGLADKHIAEPILSALRSNVHLTALFVDPRLETNTSSKTSTDAFRRLNEFAQNRDPRVALLNATFEDLVSYIPDLVPDTTDERLRRQHRESGGRNAV